MKAWRMASRPTMSSSSGHCSRASSANSAATSSARSAAKAASYAASSLATPGSLTLTAVPLVISRGGLARPPLPCGGTGDQGRQAIGNGRQRHALLRHRIALADGGGAVVQRVHVHRHAEGGADLVLAPIQLSDRGGVVVRRRQAGLQVGGQGTGTLDQLRP